MTLKNHLTVAGNAIVSDAHVYDLASAIRASKYPMATDTSAPTSDITKRTVSLASSQAGSGHDQFLTGIVVNFDLTFSNKAWVEMERYTFVNFVSSQSTMHRIARFNLDTQMNEYVSEEAVALLQQYVAAYQDEPTKENYLNVLYNTPSGFQLTARLTTNYRALKTVYAQRRTHRLPEWRLFCEWCETLPHFLALTQGTSTENH